MTSGGRTTRTLPYRLGLSPSRLGRSTSTDARASQVLDTIDDVDDAFWLLMTYLGIVVGAGAGGAGILYAVTAPAGSRAAMVSILAVMVAGSFAVLLLPPARLASSPHRSMIFGVWAAAFPVAATALMWLDGSVASPFLTLYFLALIFAASAASPPFVVAVGILSAAGFVLIHVVTDAVIPWTWSTFAGQMVALVAITSVWLATSQRRRAGWLRHLSTDLAHLAGNHSSLLAAAGEGIYMVDADGRITFANPMACRLLERDPDELLGVDAHAKFHHSRRDGTAAPVDECDIAHAMNLGHRLDAATSVYWRPDGAPFEVDHSIAPLDGGGAVVLFRDVSELRAAQRQKDEFISVVSHELRTPLTSVRGALGLLAGGAAGELGARALEMIQIASRNADRLSRLIDDMLDIERLQSGKAMLQLQTSDMRTLVEASIQAMQAMADEAGVSLRSECTALPVLVDPDRIQQILTNLLSNAIKFSPPGEAVVVRGGSDSDKVRIDVVDRGRGIPPTHVERIFGRFEQVDASDSRSRGGTGLGLAICEGLVGQHGGRIWVESVLGEGSTFSFTLPQPDHARETRGHGPLMLVVSDDLSTRDAAMSILSAGGYQVTAASSAAEGLRLALEKRPLAVVIDAALPDDEGGVIVAALAQRPDTASLPVIVMGGTDAQGRASPPVAAGSTAARLDRTLVDAVADAVSGPHEEPLVLIVEDDVGLAEDLVAGLRDGGVRAAHAVSIADARAWCARARPDAILVDLVLPDGNGTALMRWLKDQPDLAQTSLAVYSLRDLVAIDRLRLGLTDDQVFVKSRSTPQAVVACVLDLAWAAREKTVGV